VSQWLVSKSASLLDSRTSRRSFLAKAAVVGSALTVSPLRYVMRPGTAYAAICNCAGSSCNCGSPCCDGYTEFCCTINGGSNSCPPGSFPAGWWAASGSRLCPSGTRYVVDCNAHCGNGCGCGCANGNCGNRKVCCNYFRYGQCHQEISCYGRIVCRMSTCTPPYQLDLGCTPAALYDNATANHSAPCLTDNRPREYVRTPDGKVYRPVGGAPLFIFSCQPLGECLWRDVPNLSGFAPFPADGTYVRGAESRNIYRVAGGAPLYITSCAPPELAPACSTYVDVNQATIDILDHLLPVPLDGTYIRAVEGGAIYRVAGGAPLYVSDCTPLGGCPSFVNVNRATIDSLDHLRAVPADGTYIRAAEGGAIYRVAGGAPLYISDCAPLGGCPGFVNVNRATIDSLDHLRAVPADGTYIRAAEGGAIYRVAGGAPIYIEDCTFLGGCPGFVNVNRSAIESLDHLRAVPADGTVLQGRPSNQYWRIVGGCRQPTGATSAAVAVTDAAVSRFPSC